MGNTILFEDFTSTEVEEVEPSLTYEDGYSTGFEAGIAQAQATQDAISSEMLQVLSDLSFTYAQARHDLLKSLEPLFDSICTALLPALAQSSLGPQLVEFLLQNARDLSADPALVVSAHPSEVAALKSHLNAQFDAPIQFEPDGSFEVGQVLLKHNENETIIDMTEAVENIIVSLSALRESQNDLKQSGYSNE
ncbi:hypothetical protein [Aestuariibius sp. HNIBRBA575]|uniref:hypothetical protein n=1 Tax=Aestuariibius sp. HNIBRBA575 TaxID=3233343 RepID=UPI0034A10A8F